MYAIVAPTAALALLACALVAGASAQFSSQVNLVEVYATVTDETGRVVTDLKREEFDVLEDGARQEITAFTAGEFPLSAAIAIDRSFSMTEPRLAAARNAARVFVGALRPEDQAMIIAVGSQVETLAPLTSDRASLYNAIDGVDRFGSTSLHDAVIESIAAIQPARGRRALLLLSDGDDRYSRATATQALDRARESDVLVYPIALGGRRPSLFAELAASTGGRSAHVRDARALPEMLREIATELRHQYLLGYTPARALDEQGEWRSIEVRVKRPRLAVRARGGYRIK